MLEGKIDYPIDHLKPTMKALLSIDELKVTGDMVCMVKADGEFTLMRFERNKGPAERSFTVNKYGHYRQDFPALNEAVEALEKVPNLDSAEILCELFAVDDQGRPMILPDFIKAAKGRNRKLENLRIGVWDLVEVNEKPVYQEYDWKLREMSSWFEGCEKVFVLPWEKLGTSAQIRTFWELYVEGFGYEGIVVRADGEIFKVKPVLGVDAVIIAINKIGANGRPVKGYAEKLVRSVRVALMDSEGRFVVIGDCTIPKPPIQKELWKLHDFKVQEDGKQVYVHPIVIIQIRFNSLFKGSVCEILEFDGNEYSEAGDMKFWRMRHPRFMQFRADKEVNERDLRLDQVEYESEG